MEKKDLRELIDSGVLQENPDAQLVKNELNKLAVRGFVRELSDQFFEFENNLTWEVVYETLLYSERRRLHDLVACHIEKHHDGQLEGVSDVLAYHYEKSGNIKKCIWFLAIAGERAAAMYANDDAISNYSRALELLDQSGKMLASDKGMLMEKIADVCETMGRYDDATSYYLDVLDIANINKTKRKSKILPWKYSFSTRESELCRKLAITTEAQSEYKKAIEWLNEAQARLPKRPGSVASKIAGMKCGVLYRLGEYEDATQWGKKALKQATRLNVDKDKAYAQNILALIYLAEGKMKKAGDNFLKAAEVYEKLDDFPSIAITKSNMALCSLMTGDFSNAIDNYSKALEVDERIQNVSDMAIDHTNLAEVLIMVGEIEKAETHLGFVQSAYEDKLCPPDLAGLAYVYLCRCEIINGDLPKSKIAIDKGLELIRSAGQKVILGQAELQLAELLYAQENYTQAENACLNSLSVIQELEMKPLEVIGKRILAEVKSRLGFDDEAVDFIHESIEMAIEIGAKYDEAKGVVVMVSIMRKMLNAPMTQSAQDKCLGRVIKMLEKMGAKRELLKANSLILH